MAKWSSSLVVLWVAVAACSKKEAPPASRGAPASSTKPTEARGSIEREGARTMKLTSSAFEDQSPIAKKYTCQGDDVSPPLSWSGAPENTKSFAFVLDDPDAPDPAAPKTVWVHWVLYNLPQGTQALSEGVAKLPSDTLEGKNDWKRTGYRGPCPPIGRHRYVHELYALDSELPDLEAPTKAELERAMQGHVLAQTELVGTYQKE
jgi:hypothetical protein